ncbi:MAG: hypothetical protein IJP17_06710 [Clostridia bacterium]|nr:hypothetical protein [Clostridia bacterium]
MSIKLSYALSKDGRIVHISEAMRGTACDCVCPSCGDSLIAKKGDDLVHHFAHISRDDCIGGYHASLCYAFMRGISRLRSLYMPPYMKNRSIEDEGSGMTVIVPEAKIPIERVEMNKSRGVVTGLTAYCSGRPLLIRFLTSYSTSASKNLKRIAEVGLPMIEIDLSRQEMIDDSVIFDYLTKPSDEVYWIYNAVAEGIWEKMKEKCMNMPVLGEENAIYTYGCIIPSKRTDGFRCYIKDKCARCEYFFGIYGFGDDKHILCGRQNLITEAEDLNLTLEQRKRKYGAIT